MTRIDKKLTLVNMKFSMDAYKNLNKNGLDSLSDIAHNFFHFVQSSGNKLKIRGFVNVWLLEDQIQNLGTVTYGVFQIYINDNLFNPDVNSKRRKQQNTKQKKLTKATVQTLLKELFVLNNQNKNEEPIEQYAREQNITVT